MTPTWDIEWDAGEMGCGELVMLLRQTLLPHQPGTVLRLTALDPGAREDIPAWCNMTGHRLIEADHPLYFIARRP